MVRQTLKSRLSLRKSFPNPWRASQRTTARSSTGPQPTGLIVSLSRSNYEKSIQKKMTIQNSWLWTQPFFITSLFALISSNYLLLYRSGYWLWGDYPLVGWTCRRTCLLLDVLLCLPVLWTRQIVASASSFWNQSSLSWLLWSFGWLSSLQQASYQPTSIQSCSIALTILEQPFSPFASISRNVSISEAQARRPITLRKVKAMAYSQSLVQQIRKILALKLLPNFRRRARRKETVWWSGLYDSWENGLTVSSRKGRAGYGENWQRNRKASSTPNRAHTTLMRETLSWLCRPRYRRSERTSLLDWFSPLYNQEELTKQLISIEIRKRKATACAVAFYCFLEIQ